MYDDAFKMYPLSRAINGTVGKEKDLFDFGYYRLIPLVRIIIGIDLFIGVQPVVFMADINKIIKALLFFNLHFKITRGIRLKASDFYAYLLSCFIVIFILEDIGGGCSQRLTCFA